jgi:hypothetical protein
LDKERWLALAIILLLVPTVGVPLYEGWVKDMSELATQIVSGLVVVMISVALALWYRSGHEEQEQPKVKEPMQRSEIIQREVIPQAHGKATLEFWLTSTTDWFDVGIENGTLLSIEKWEISSGNIEPPELYENCFHITQDKSQSLKMRITATFELPKHGAICLLRKADSGDIDIKVELSGFLHPIVGNCTYTRSPKEKNELTFPLTLRLI